MQYQAEQVLSVHQRFDIDFFREVLPRGAQFLQHCLVRIEVTTLILLVVRGFRYGLRTSGNLALL